MTAGRETQLGRKGKIRRKDIIILLGPVSLYMSIYRHSHASLHIYTHTHTALCITYKRTNFRETCIDIITKFWVIDKGRDKGHGNAQRAQCKACDFELLFDVCVCMCMSMCA